jgi:Flp pilus assembly protein TadB
LVAIFQPGQQPSSAALVAVGCRTLDHAASGKEKEKWKRIKHKQTKHPPPEAMQKTSMQVYTRSMRTAMVQREVEERKRRRRRRR